MRIFKGKKIVPLTIEPDCRRSRLKVVLKWSEGKMKKLFGERASKFELQTEIKREPKTETQI